MKQENKQEINQRVSLTNRLGFGQTPALIVVDIQIAFTVPEHRPWLEIRTLHQLTRGSQCIPLERVGDRTQEPNHTNLFNRDSKVGDVLPIEEVIHDLDGR
jgi:hypothetical protein